MNYNSVQEILDSGITNMTVLRRNNKQDDGSNIVQGTNWLTFCGQQINSLYANGNSYIGLGLDVQHLKVNNGDGAMYYLYREVGTLYDSYKFLKIRWVGYSHYRYTSSSYLLSYDIIFWSTGDISLHMNNIPTDYNNGTYSLTANTQTYQYTVSTASPDVTFHKTGNDTFTVINSLIKLLNPRYYLIYDNNKYYTVDNNHLLEITEMSELTANVFQTYGVDSFPKDINLYNSLSNPKILFWVEDQIGRPQTNNIIIDQLGGSMEYHESKDMSNFSGIKSAKVVASDDALFSLSFDNGVSWHYYNNNGWATVSQNDIKVGMTASQISSIMANSWADIFQPTTLKIRAYLPNTSSYFSYFYFIQ